MEWFRFYHEVLDDPKVQRLGPPLFKHWINLLCLASRQHERGTLPSVTDIAFGLRLSEAKVTAIVAELEAAGLIDRDGATCRMHEWSSRQKRSDNVADRVAKHREKQVSPVSGNVPCNVTSTVTENVSRNEIDPLPHVRATETEQNRAELAHTLSPLPPVEPFDAPRPGYPKPDPEFAERRKAAYDAIYAGFGVKEGTATYLQRWHIDHLDLSPELLAGITDDELRRCARYVLSSWKRDGLTKIPHVKHVLDDHAAWVQLGCPDTAPPRERAARSTTTRPSLPPVMQPGEVPPDGGVSDWKALKAVKNRKDLNTHATS